MALLDSASLAGTPLTSAERPSRRARAGRICGEDGCAAVLSIYNHGHHCSLHAPMVVPRTRGKKLDDATRP